MTSAPAGGYPDPENAGRSRFWDGASWTNQSSAPYAALATTAALKAPEGTRWSTLWIWLVASLPLLALLGFYLVLLVFFGNFVDATSVFNAAEAVGYLLLAIVSLFLPAFGLLCAYLDKRVLIARRIPRPFPWPWVFLGPAVHVIGRSVVVRRRTGGGTMPVWAAIVELLVALAATLYMTVVFFFGIFLVLIG